MGRREVFGFGGQRVGLKWAAVIHLEIHLGWGIKDDHSSAPPFEMSTWQQKVFIGPGNHFLLLSYFGINFIPVKEQLGF